MPTPSGTRPRSRVRQALHGLNGALYDHFGFPARYRGEIRWQGEHQPIAGVCSFEHARAVSPSLAVNRPLPERLKLPWDFFTYHVLALDDDTLLMLACVQFAGRPMLTGAYLRQLDGEQDRWTEAVIYEPLGYHDEPLVAPDGGVTRVADRFRWSFTDPVHGATDIEVLSDTPLHFGIGTGWIGGTRHHGTYRGHEISGRGYYEYADRRKPS
jgi:hypothetical protein